MTIGVKGYYMEECHFCKVNYQIDGYIDANGMASALPDDWEVDVDGASVYAPRCPACVRQNKILQRIVDERRRQDKKWGTKFSNSAERWLAILAEEFGEAAMAVVDRQYDDLDKELIQVAAVCVKFLEFFDPTKPVAHENL